MSAASGPDPGRCFGFVQWEFPGRLGPDPGRYAIRRFAGDDVRHVLVISGAEAPRRGRVAPGGRRRPRRADPDQATPPVEVTRATVIDATGLAGSAAADAWLARALGEGREALLAESLLVLSRAVAARRVAAADPWAADPDAARALVTRIGYGSGEAVADGEWDVARELPAHRGPGRRMLVPQERAAALLGGRDAALACEELALRARADLDRGRGREAALQLDIALRAALAELEGWREHRDLGERLDELAAHAESVAAAASVALRGGLGRREQAAVGDALGRLEAALRARSADGS
ncbi:MAG: hypothetical protein QOK21_3814 [Solirubrobacteraceae bacterium]|nr:hypothetical protein [Solirubrobacteraceae bacterium]